MHTALESFRLTVFRIVAERQSFSSAAEVLHVSQPAVTAHVKALEEALGVRLFERTNAGARLTKAGERLHSYAREVNRLTQETLREIGSMSGETRGRLCVGASTTIAQYLLPRLLAGFLEVHPRIELSVLSANTEKIVAQVVARKMDLGLIEGPPGTSELRLENFVQDEIAVIVPAEHPFAGRRDGETTIAELAAEPLLLRETGSGTRRVVEDALRKAGVALRSLRIVMELDSTEAIKSGVEAGLGVAFVSRWALRQSQSQNIRAIHVKGLEIYRTFQFICPHGPEPEGPAGAFLGFLRQFREEYSTPA
jgi:LysR family transcriptional regulator, transcriptional activator of the cysJI operon